MKQGKTEYRFGLNADMLQVEAVIRNWLMTNKFEVKREHGSTCYAFNDPIVKGKRGFEYFIHNNEVTILVYIGTYEQPFSLEREDATDDMSKESYRNELAELFAEIQKIGNTKFGNATNSLNPYADKNKESDETYVIVGFIMSIVSLVISCLGISAFMLIVLELYFGIRGLKTSKRGLAIATIVLASVNIFVLIGLFVVAFVLGMIDGFMEEISDLALNVIGLWG